MDDEVPGDHAHRARPAPVTGERISTTERFREVGRNAVLAEELGFASAAVGSETPAGVIQPTGAKLDIPTAGFWYVEDGKIKKFNCYVGLSIILAQLGVQPDFASAAATPAL